MKHITLFFLIFCSYVVAFAQQAKKHPVSGKVIDNNGMAIPYANIVAYTPEGKIAGGVATTNEGKFKFALPQGKYVFKISFLSYKKYRSDTILLNKPLHLKDIVLEPDNVMLEAVEITGEQSRVELKLDKRVFNVGKDLTNTGATATEVLERVPGVTVDMDGNVQLRNSGNIRVLIDGRPSAITGVNLSDALRQIPADMIEKVEVITNPSAKYDAEGEVGIINIVLKKTKTKGINLSLNVTAAYPYRNNITLNFSKRFGKLNVFTNIGGVQRQVIGGGYTYQEVNRDTVLNFEKIREHHRNKLGYNIRGGIDYDFNKTTSITLSGYYAPTYGGNTTDYSYKDYNGEQVLMRKIFRHEFEDEFDQNAEASIFFRKEWKNKKEWTIDGKWLLNTEYELSDIQQTNTADAEKIFQSTLNDQRSESYYLQTDYVHPINEKLKFETGVKYSDRTILQKFELSDSSNGERVIISEFTDDLTFIEKIYAAYFITNYTVNKWNIQAGIRGERTELLTALKNSGEEYPRTFNNPFPSVHVSYKKDSTTTYQVSYSRRISRPGLFNLSPFISFSDNRDYFSGNPNLNPEFTDAFEISYLKNLKKGTLLASAYYRYRTNVIQRVTEVDSNAFTRRYPVNMAYQNAVGIESNVNYSLFKGSSLNINLNFYYSETQGSFEGENLYASTMSFNGMANYRMRIMKKWTLQSNIFYRAPRNTLQGKMKYMAALDLGINRSFMKKKLNVTFNVRDVFNTRKWRFETDLPGFYADGYFQWQVRRYALSVVYQIAKSEASRRNKRKNNRFDSPSNGGEMGF